MLKICIVNAHWSNRGDEAALRPLIDSILNYSSEIELTVIFKDRKEVRQFPYEGRVKYFSAQYLPKDLAEVEEIVEHCDIIANPLSEIVRTLRKQNLIVYSPGGAVISDKFWWTKQLEYLLPFMCAGKFSVPIVVAAPSIGPFDDDKDKNLLRHQWLSYANKICVREPISAEYLKKLQLTNVEVTIDTAFYDEPHEADVIERWNDSGELRDFFLKHKKMVGFTLSDFSWNVEYREKGQMIADSEKIVRNFIHKLSEKGYGILLIPQLFGNQNDSEYLKQFSETNVFILSDRYDTYFQQYVISKCYAVVGMRYHSNIFAAKMGVPFIAIGYEEKMYGFMENWGLSDFLIRLPFLTEPVLLEKWHSLQDNYETYKNYLKNHRSEWHKLASKTIDAVMTNIS
jgi:colanic acid/amylovoran biosynthesis protein